MININIFDKLKIQFINLKELNFRDNIFKNFNCLLISKIIYQNINYF